MIDPCRQNQQIVLLNLDPHPLILLTPNIEIALSVTNVSNLLVLMQMLREEHLDFVLVRITHLFRRDDDLVSVLVASLGCYGVHIVDVGAVVVVHAEGGEVGCVDWASGVVRSALVTLDQNID